MKTLTLIATLFVAVVAEAGIEVRSFSLTALPDGTYHYSYRLRLVSGRLDPGGGAPQIVTLYDVKNIIPGSLEVAGPWGGVLQFTGQDPNDIPRASADHPSIQNITLKFTGATAIYAPADVGSFGYRVPAGPTSHLVYTSQSVSPAAGGVGMIGRVFGPVSK